MIGFKPILIFVALVAGTASKTLEKKEINYPELTKAKGDQGNLDDIIDKVDGKSTLAFTIERRPTIFDQVGHFFETARYGLKGFSQVAGSSIGYPAGAVVGLFSHKVSIKDAAINGAYLGSKIVGAPFSKTRPLTTYGQTYVPGKTKYIFIPNKFGQTYL